MRKLQRSVQITSGQRLWADRASKERPCALDFAKSASRLPSERDAAYVSLAYNVGIRGIGRSTATRGLNAGGVAGGCQALTWWNKAGGRVVCVLVRRRTDEYRLCMLGVS
ncbi:glycoside hydrolase family protein [Pseudophaeobacter sp. EL27]|uniref:glycoside hydrolase family protein n=1 Tax=Pseudophaeobacter sp. EL27 TaxID=2107580 RepID=UPI0020B1151E|nr:glycoside hydrolase family protein [Pseudophaeobacter sp. EL27]